MTLAELKAKATELGLTPDDVRAYGNLSYKATWESAIANFNLTVEEEEEEEDLSQLTTEELERYQVECEKQERWIDQVLGRERNEDNTVQRNTDKELPFEPTHTLIDGEWVESADIVDPSQLPTLKETDERFKDWESWMIPGAVFQSSRFRYTILYFDRFGNCQCKASHSEPLEDGRWHSLRINFIKECGGQTGWRLWDKEQQTWVKINSPDDLLKDCYMGESEPVKPFTPSSELPSKLTELTEPIDVKENLLRRMAEHGTPAEEIEKLRHEPLDFCTAYLGEFLLNLADSFRELTHES